MPTFGTVCDGIGCGHLAFNRAGFDCAWSFEIEAFPSAVLAYRFPDVKNHGDMLKCVGMIESGEIEAPDVFIGGTPCQAFSVAGKRKGLEDARGNLSLTFCGIADAIDAVRERDGKQPCAVCWENVPGVLSDKGNAFGCFLGEMAGSGCELQPPGGRWGKSGCVFGPKRVVAWTTLDSQWFGVAQRRSRVFVVASAGDGCRPEEVLLIEEGMRRDSPPSREKGQGTVRGVEIGPSGGCFTDLNPTLDARRKDGPIRNQLAGAVLAYQTYDMGGNGDGVTVGTLTGDHAGRPTDYTPVVAFSCKDNGRDATEEVAPCLRAMGGKRNDRSNGDSGGGQVAVCMDVVAQGMQVRRLTPRECERLQALPDDWGRIPWNGKYECQACGEKFKDIHATGVDTLAPAECPRCGEEKRICAYCPDGPRYKGIGNGQTVTVMEWLARRIMAEMTR